MKSGDLVKWAWQLQEDSWEETKMIGIVLRVAGDHGDLSNRSLIDVLDNTGQKVRMTSDMVKVISADR